MAKEQVTVSEGKNGVPRYTHEQGKLGKAVDGFTDFLGHMKRLLNPHEQRDIKLGQKHQTIDDYVSDAVNNAPQHAED